MIPVHVALPIERVERLVDRMNRRGLESMLDSLCEKAESEAAGRLETSRSAREQTKELRPKACR